MIVKEIHFGDDGQKKLKSGIKKIAGAVKSTLGARGRTVLIESENHVGGITVTKDGVTVAKSINLYDPTENLAVMMMRQAADKTATVAGDGTTTSIVLAEAIIDAADKYLTPEHNVTEVIRGISALSKKVVDKLDKMSKKVNGKRLYDVATISANNDQEIGKMIGDAFSEVPLVTVENSMNSKACNIIPPSFGYRQKDLLKDLAVALGGTYFSEDTGDDLSIIGLSDLGKAAKVIVKKDVTVFMHHADFKEDIDKHIADLKAMVDQTDNKEDKDFIRERIANISGGIGVIYVGAQSDIEQKEKRDRIDDAVYAVMAAIEDGILPGGGIALSECAAMIYDEFDVSAMIMHDALLAPFDQILINAGKKPTEIAMGIFDKGNGYDVKGERFGDMIKMGIIDPTKVTKNALLNAVSVATTIMSTNAIITNIRADESPK